MSEALENLILNPVEFTPELPELDLNDLGLTIAAKPGPDYGESSMTVERVRKAIGEGVTDAHWPAVECTIPIIARGGKELAIADPLHRLEAWVADVQRRRTGWVRRDFSTDGGFSGSVGAHVDSAALTPAQGWSFAHREFASGITLKFARWPIWYATVEIEAGEAKGSGVRDLQLELADLLGTAPGLIRIVAKNEGAEDWRGCMVAIECDDYSAAATALPKYEARELTLRGGSTSTEVGGAKVVKCPPLTSGWVTVLSSQIAGVGHMTHVGTRRMAFRINDVSALLGDVQWKLEWRALGSASWIQTRDGSTPLVVSSPVVGNYQLLDLGECRPPRALTGDQRWEWRLQAESISGSGAQPLIRDIYPAPTEQWMRVADAAADPYDGEAPKGPVTIVDDSSSGGTISWAEPTKASNLDGSYATANNSPSGESRLYSHYLQATGFGFSIPETATVLGVVAAVTRRPNPNASNSIFDKAVRLVVGGAIKGANRAAGEPISGTGPNQPGFWDLAATTAQYGNPSDLWEVALTPAIVNAANFGIVFQVGFREWSNCIAEVDAITLTVFYGEGAAGENRVCFASRSVEFADNGIRRQHVTDEVWGELIPDGFPPYAPPPGQGGQPVRMLIVPSVGDFATRADSALVSAGAAAFYRPGCLFAREAV